MTSHDRHALVRSALERRITNGGNAFPSLEVAVKRIAEEQGLVFYFGIDPTGSDVHIGHTVSLLLLADLVRFGHKAVLLMGDFTARVGDPTGKDASRAVLTAEQVAGNMEHYVQQVKRVIGETPFEVRYNSEWLASLTMEKLLQLTGMVTVQQMIQRDMFQQRLKEERPIAVSEFLYPLMQGYDSVALGVDGEIGGNDQTFNMLVGRDLARELAGKDKLVLATRLLAAVAGGKKMSKTEGNLIAVSDTPQEIRRKVLALDDTMTQSVFELCTGESAERIHALSEEPRAFKEALAEALIAMYHGADAVAHAKEPLPADAAPLVEVLVQTGVAKTATGAKRLIDEGAVSVDGETVREWKTVPKTGAVVQVGKGKFIKIR